MELLIPAGNRVCLEAAVKYGADAVYLSGQRFGARKYADNFDHDSLRSAVEFCHLYGVRTYVTVNTLVFDREREELCGYIDYLSQIGVDAVIVQDLGVASIVKRVAPELPIHASTQMVIHDLPGALMAKEMGFTRVVLARELSLEEIRHISKNVDIELEVFGHGALCMSYSGQCYMSSIIGGRSGNRGSCAQPCRLKYRLDGHSGQFLSLKDLCSLNHIDRLREAGVTSLKIEGRMKGPSYVSVVTDVYRTCLDGKKPTQDDFDRLRSAFDRDGFTDGYLLGKTGREMFSYVRPENPYHDIQFPDKARRIPIEGSCEIKINQPVKLTVTDGCFTIFCESGCVAEPAERISLSVERVTSQLSKTNDTPFFFSNLQVDLDDGCALPIKEINALRREALSQLAEKRRLAGRREPSGYEYVPAEIGQVSSCAMKIFVSVETEQQADIASKYADVLFLPAELWDARRKYECKCVLTIPRFASETLLDRLREIADMTCAEVMVSDLGQLHHFKNFTCYGSFELNVTNTDTLLMLKELGLDYCGISYEMSLRRMRDLKKAIPVFAFGYGHMPLMITKNCLVQSALGKCSCPAELIDRTGASFSVVKSEGCRNEIRNGTVLFNADRLADFSDSGVSAVFLKMTSETPTECEKVIKMYRGEQVTMPDKYTRGHLYKNIE